MATTIVETIDPKTAPPPCYAGRKRPQALALTVYDPAAAAEAQHAKRTTQSNISASAGALVPFVAPPPIDAAPLAVAAPNRAEPSWLRTKLLELGFRLDTEVFFIDEKTRTASASRTDGVQRHLRGMLSAAQQEAADMLHQQGPRARTPKQPQIEGEQGGNRKKKKKGKKHVGLPVVVVDISGLRKELKLTQWASSRGTVIKGDRYLEFIRQCSFKKDDVVEIWAFKEKTFRFFGVNMCVEGPLHVLIAKKEQ